MERRWARCLALAAWFLGVAAAAVMAQDGQPPRGNLVYQIFVRSFCDSSNPPDGLGDLAGVTSKLDAYLNDGKPETSHDLEAGILWLMPIFPAMSYHGYDVTDYRSIRDQYGTLDDFRTLIREAHQRGVRVILDVPFNHTSDKHPWFKEAVGDPVSPRRKFYHIQPIEPGGAQPSPGWYRATGQAGEVRYLGVFGPDMPDLDFDNPDVRREVQSIADFWLDLGVDGFRLDAAKHIYGDSLTTIQEAEILKNCQWWREFSSHVYQRRRDAIVVGEVLGNREMLRRHAWGLDGLLDEPFMNNLRRMVAWPYAGFVGAQKQFIEQARDVNRLARVPPFCSPDHPFDSFLFAASHDRNPRLASDLEQMEGAGMGRSVNQAYRLAAYILLLMARYPILYQGDEVMQRGWKWNGNPPNHPQEPGDGSGLYNETLREPFPWYRSGKGPGQTAWDPRLPKFSKPGVSKEDQEQPGGMLHLVRGLTHLRSRHPALANGEVGSILSDSQDWLVFEKVQGNDRYLVLIDLMPNGETYRFHEAWYPQYRKAQVIFWSDGRTKEWRDTTADGKYIEDGAFVPPFGLVVLRQAPAAP